MEIDDLLKTSYLISWHVSAYLCICDDTLEIPNAKGWEKLLIACWSDSGYLMSFFDVVVWRSASSRGTGRGNPQLRGIGKIQATHD